MLIRFRPIYWLITANIVMVSVLAYKFSTLPPQIPLFYSKPPGEDQLADTWMILLLPLLMNFLFFFNNFFYRRYFNENVLAKKILYYFNLLISISFTIIFVKIIFVVT